MIFRNLLESNPYNATLKITGKCKSLKCSFSALLPNDNYITFKLTSFMFSSNYYSQWSSYNMQMPQNSPNKMIDRYCRCTSILFLMCFTSILGWAGLTWRPLLLRPCQHYVDLLKSNSRKSLEKYVKTSAFYVVEDIITFF
jgi:hypothetical protein